MTTGAGDFIVARQQWIEKQIAAQIDLRRCEAIPNRGQSGFETAHPSVVEGPISEVLAVKSALTGLVQSECWRAVQRESEFLACLRGSDRSPNHQ